MSVSIGIVCEGLHDFNILKAFINQIGADHGIAVGAIECLQPQVSASFQTTRGGWGRVKGWCEQGAGKAYRVHLDKPLFGISRTYDVLLIHLDGDVVSLCNSDPLSALFLEDLHPSAAVIALKNAIKNHWLSLETSHSNKVVVCAPVWHMEAWLLAALDPDAVDVELRPTKDEFRNGIYKKYQGKTKNRYLAAAKDAANKTQTIREKCFSFAAFCEDIVTAASGR